MNIKKQIQNLYLYEIISGIQIVDMVWVFFLLQRGFSLAQAGIAEGFFHVVSMCCEIPSGMISDTFGRRRTLIFSGVLSAFSSLCMIVSDCFPIILIGMGFNALSYNFVSGTREALTYDSLLEVGAEEQYLKISSTQELIYQGLCGVSCLASIFIVTWGYKKAYLLAVGQGILCALCAFRLKEAQINEKGCQTKLIGKILLEELKKHFATSLHFLFQNKSIRRRMILMGSVNSGCYLIFMFMQEHLVDIGLNARFIGIPLVVISLCSMMGAALSEKTRKVSLEMLTSLGGCIIVVFIVVSGIESLIPVVLAAGIAHGISEILVIRLENENQREFSSEIRATMISVESMIYSVWMAVLSPFIGWIAKQCSILSAFAVLGSVVLISVCINVVHKDC